MGSLSGTYGKYSAINKRLAQGESVFFGLQGSVCSFSSAYRNADRVLRYPKIGVYVGTGASHSWLWFVELFDRMGFYDVVFLDENQIQRDGLKGLDILAMSGGDTFAIAKGLGSRGSKNLEAFVRGGGLYLGSCAGAYLPLNSSKEYLNLFNFANVKIANLAKTLPEAKRVPEKFCTAYGCSFIFHPVREEVRLTTDGIPPLSGVDKLLAPLYGGPPMIASDNAEVLARYEGFTNKTQFLVDNDIAETTIIGKAAAIKTKMGSGHFYLFGPHFEHPRFPLANKLMADVIYWDMRDTPLKTHGHSNNNIEVKGDKAKKLINDIKRELSNCRIVALGIEMMPTSWLIGTKVYEPAKIRVFIEAMWTRIKALEKQEEVIFTVGEDSQIIDYASDTTILLRKIRKEAAKGLDTLHLARQIFKNLNIMTTKFLTMYFRTFNVKFRELGV